MNSTVQKRAIGITVIGFVIAAVAGVVFGQMRGESPAVRVQRIEDRQAIEQLLMGDYPRALDAFDWQAYAALFAKDGTLIMNGGAITRTGPAAIEQYFTNAHFPTPPASAACPAKPGAPRFMHVVTNLSVHIDGDTATDQAYWETIGTTDCKSVVEGAGHYEDVLKREGGQWKFHKRQIFDDLPPRAAQASATPSSTPSGNSKQ